MCFRFAKKVLRIYVQYVHLQQRVMRFFPPLGENNMAWNKNGKRLKRMFCRLIKCCFDNGTGVSMRWRKILIKIVCSFCVLSLLYFAAITCMYFFFFLHFIKKAAYARKMCLCICYAHNAWVTCAYVYTFTYALYTYIHIIYIHIYAREWTHVKSSRSPSAEKYGSVPLAASSFLTAHWRIWVFPLFASGRKVITAHL